jgi:RHS repeat-associated protein
VPRAWLATERRDPRGNGTQYDWCFAANEEDGYDAEYAIDQIRYTTFEDQEPTRSISFVYGVKEDARCVFSGGMEFQQSLRLDEIQMHAEGMLARRYVFEFDRSAITGRTRLTSVEECGADGACKAPVRFHYDTKAARGFDKVETTIDAPLSLKASPIFADMNGDGLSDWLVPDTTPQSTAEKPITEWRLARNTGNGFTAPKVSLSQEWSFVENPEGPNDPAQLQPELGTVLHYNDDSRADLLVHDVYNNRPNYLVLASNNDATFHEIDTGIPRPFPAGPAPAHLRGARGATHLFDANADGMQDLLSCDDHGSTPEIAALPTWTLHFWQPGGWDKTGEIIEKLQSYPCGLEMYTLDTDANGTTDLILPGMIKQGGTPSERAPNFYAFRRKTDGSWESYDTNLRIPQGRILFGDFNGDGLPDALTGDVSGRLVTWMNTGKGFAELPENALDWDALLPQTKYMHLAAIGDFDQNGQADVLLPLVDAISPDIPRWVILRATGGTFTFERTESGIPFEPVLSDGITLADPRGPRIGDANGDGAPDVALYLGNRLQLYLNTAADADVLVGLSDGLTERDRDDPAFVPNVSISYGHLTDGWITNGEQPNDPKKEEYPYLSRVDPTNIPTYPRRAVVGPKRVVREYALNDGQGGQRRFGLRYRDGRYDRRGYGFLGFAERILTDLDTGATTVTFYDNETFVDIGRNMYPFVGQVKSQWQWAPALLNEPNPNQVEVVFADTILEAVPTNGGQTYFTIPRLRHTRRMQGAHTSSDSLETWVASVEANENATMLRDTTVDFTEVDEFGNVLGVEVSTVGVDLTLAITRTVKNDTDRWILGQMQFQKECSSASGLSQCRTITRTTNEFGEVEKEETDSNDGIDDTKLTVAFDERDKYGHVTHVTATDAFGHKRESTTVYDDRGIYPEKHINALGHETRVEYDAALGVLKKHIDPNGLSTEWAHDSLGRLEAEIRPDGSQTTMTRAREKIDGIWRTKERTTTTGGADDETIFDNLGRPVRTFTHGPTPANQKDGPRIMQVIEYDRLSGNVARKSVPNAEGTPEAQLKWDSYDFDALGREIRHTTPWNAVTTTHYHGFLIDSTDPLLNHTKTALDPLGRPMTVTDAANGPTKYVYGPYDTLYTVTDPGGAVTKWTRDAFGRVRQLDEPDRGTTKYVNDGFGELIESTDALGRVTTFGLDALGRLETRTDKLGAQVLTTTWTWDTAANGIGRLHSLMSPDGIKTYGYNKRGQTESMTLGVNGDAFVAQFAYDEFGRVEGIDYPQPLGMATFGVTHDYDAHGYRIGVRDKETNDAFWELQEVDHAGRIQRERFGNEVETTRWYYDDKQSLKSITTLVGGKTIQDLSYEWDERLNLKSRADALQVQNTTERFKYDALNRLTCAYFGLVGHANALCDTSYGYAPNGNLTTKSDVGILSYTDPKHPHAVTSAAGGSYEHDAVGNQITRPGGVSIAYTSFDLPKTITQPGKTVSFGYDGEQRRIRKTSATSETIYFEDLYERVTNGTTTEHRYFVHSPERVVAIVTRGGPEAGTKTLHVDHLGSIETVTNEKGEPVEKRSYDAFGARRNPQWGLPGAVAPGKTKKGFTGHEEEDEFGLVNMKGRLLDPKIGRFTTTDPVIANVYNGQSFGAYSYVRNNPLTLVDPSGFEPEEPPILPISTTITKEADGSITVDLVYPPRISPVSPNPAKDAASAGASAPPVDTSTTGNGDETDSDQDASGGLDVMLDVVGGAASAYGRDAADAGLGFVGLTVAPTLYLSWKAYGLGKHVLEEVENGYAYGGFGGAIEASLNVFNPFAQVGISLAATIDAAEKGDYKKAGELGYQAAKGILGIAAAAIGVGIGRGGGGNLHAEALAARDKLAVDLAQSRHPPATVVGAYSPSSGRVTAGASRGRGLGCAESVCADALGNPRDIQFTSAIRPRTGEPIPVCSTCESTFGRNAFPEPGTLFQSDKGIR